MNSGDAESKEEDCNECLKENIDVDSNIIEEIDFLKTKILQKC